MVPSLLSSTTSPLGFPNFREFLWACFLLSPLYISRCCLLLQLLLYNKTRDTSNSGDGLRNHILPLMLIRTLRPLSTPIPQSPVFPSCRLPKLTLLSQAIGYLGFEQFMKMYLEVEEVPHHLCWALFWSFHTSQGMATETESKGMILPGTAGAHL